MLTFDTLEGSNIKKVNRIWLTCPWEVNLLMGNNPKLERTNQLADYLSQRGYDVTLWFTSFQHPDKTYIAHKNTIVDFRDNLHIVLLHCPVPYKKNTSLMRFFHLVFLANEMRKLIKDEKKFPVPDVILSSYPTEQNCRVLEKYAKIHKIPIILDARDEWPDIFKRAIPPILMPIGNVSINFMKKKTAKVFRNADAICAVKPDLLEWALKYAGRDKTERDMCINFSARKEKLEQDVLKKELLRWAQLDVTENTWNICLFSTLSSSVLDAETLFEAVEELYKEHSDIRLIIGGKGDQEAKLKQLCKDSKCIRMPGYLNNEEMLSLMSISQIGLVPYRNLKDFDYGAGNKVAQYFSYGLPIITSLQKWGKEYLVMNKCGLVYEEGNSKDLVKLLRELIEEKNRIAELKRGAERQYSLHFSEETNMRKFENIINLV